MTPALSDTLRALALALPSCVKREVSDLGRNEYWYAWVSVQGGHWALIGVESKHHAMLPTEYGAVMLEVACRQEIDARGWTWSVESSSLPGQYLATVYRAGGMSRSHVLCAYGPSAGHSLAIALLSALSAAQAAAMAADRQQHPEHPLDVQP